MSLCRVSRPHLLLDGLSERQTKYDKEEEELKASVKIAAAKCSLSPRCKIRGKLERFMTIF